MLLVTVLQLAGIAAGGIREVPAQFPKKPEFSKLDVFDWN